MNNREYIINPKTGKPVERDGVIGYRIVSEVKIRELTAKVEKLEHEKKLMIEDNQYLIDVIGNFDSAFFRTKKDQSCYLSKSSHDDNCTVCLEPLTTDKLCHICKRCKVAFHSKCAEELRSRMCKCPVCRFEID